MSHLALYREFRPDSFDKIIGQEHVVRTLVNQINMGKIGHAYLFCGARGTGKTTAAKVFARAINCLSPVNGSPCGECEVCKKLKSPENLDIVEMDAASNNGVDDIRELREKVQYPPTAGRYKVYIIDEVHMLSAGAFNAFLKTLEEPPAHAVFILATTEVHKIPPTILSRCMRFDFKLIKTAEIAALVAKIYDITGKKYEKEAVDLIAKAGEGSVRDALSIADICVSYSDGVLKYDDVLEVLGASDRAKIERLVKNLFASDTGEMLSLIDELCSLGKSVSVLNKDVCGALRDLLVVKTCKNPGEILQMPADKLSELTDIAKNAETGAILRSIEIFSACEADLKYSTHPKIIFETAAVKASLPEIDYNIDALMARVSRLEKKLESGIIPSAIEKPAAVTAGKAETAGKLPLKEEETSVHPGKEKDIPKEEAFPKKEEEKQYAPERKAEPAVKQKEDSGDTMPYPEEPFDDGFYEEPYNPGTQKESVKKETVDKGSLKEAKKPEPVMASESSGPDATLIWGSVLRKLRQNKEIMLWVACQDVSVSLDKGCLVMVAPGTSEYNLLSKPENVAKLSLYAGEKGITHVEVLEEGLMAEARKKSDDITEKVKKFMEGEKLEIVD